MHDHQGQFGKCFRTSVLVSIVLVVTTSTSFSEEPKLPCIFTAKSYEEANAAEIKSARRPVSVSAAADDKNRIVEAVKKISIDVKDAQAYIEVVRADSKASSDQIASALDCQGKLARFLVGQQTASSSSSTRAMTKFNATIAQETQIATVHIARALTPVALVGDKDVQQKAKDKNTEQRKLLDPYVNSHLYNDLGFDISTSVPIQSATLADYAKQELLLRHGGLVNLYGSLAGKNFANAIYKWGDRASNIDRSYFVDTLQHVEPATAQQAMLFWSHGLGIKALKTQLEGTGDIGLQGTVYLGIGADGPLFVRDIDSAKVGETEGMFSIEGFATYNYVTKKSLDTLFTVDDAKTTFASAGVNLMFYITNAIGIQVEYATTWGGDNTDLIGHTVSFSVNYNNK